MKETGINRLRIPALAAMLVVSTGLIGCANTTEMQSMSSRIDAAAADAQAARAEAAEAKAMAMKAMNTADSARAIATDANSTSMATEAKIDRMFKKAMYK